LEHPPHDPANIEIKITMLVHIDSTAVHIFHVKIEDKTETTTKIEWCISQLSTPIPKENSDWLKNDCILFR